MENTSSTGVSLSKTVACLLFCLIIPGSGLAQTPTAGTVDFWQAGDSGQRMSIRGQVTSLDGTPVAGATIYIRQADGEGIYHSQYSGNVVTNQRGNYQFGSVVPGNYMGERHVHIYVDHDDYQYLDTEILFKDDPNLVDGDDQRAVFLEAGEVDGETMMFGRFDMTLVPN